MFAELCSYVRELLRKRKPNVCDVFTPTMAATINYVSREGLESQIIKSIKTPGKQIVLYGYSGSGKTTIIQKILKQLNIRYIISHCDRNTTLESLFQSAYDNLNEYYVKTKTSTESNTLTSSLKSDVAFGSSSLNASKSQSSCTAQERVVSPQFSPQNLAKIFGSRNLVWVIEDFHKVPDIEKIKIADTMKVFVDYCSNYRNLKIVCIGACETARLIVQHDSNMMHRVDQIAVKMLEEREVRSLILNGCKLLNISMEQELVDSIIEYSSRVGSLAHQMCLDICYANQIEMKQKNTVLIKKESFSHAVDGFLRSNSDTFMQIYEDAVKEQLGWYILKTFSVSCDKSISFDYIKQRVNGKNRNFSDDVIKQKLDSFITSEPSILYYNSNSGRYAISTPLWATFLKIQFDLLESKRKNKRRKFIQRIDQTDEDAEFKKLMMDLLKEFEKIRSQNSTIE